MDKITLSAPTMPVFWVSVVLAILALIGQLFSAGFLTTQRFWIAILAYVVLLIGNLFKGA